MVQYLHVRILKFPLRWWKIEPGKLLFFDGKKHHGFRLRCSLKPIQPIQPIHWGVGQNLCEISMNLSILVGWTSNKIPVFLRFSQRYQGLKRPIAMVSYGMPWPYAKLLVKMHKYELEHYFLMGTPIINHQYWILYIILYYMHYFS